MGFEDLVSKINKKNQFEKVCVDQGVIDSVVFYSKKSYPNEFLAMFDGHVKDKVLYITGLLFLPGERSHTSATFNDWMIPPNQKKWGSVHSHPGNNANPSHADLMTFSKHGPFHIILCEPYSLETMKAYDAYGNPTTFEVGAFSDENKDLMFEDLEEIKEEIDKMDGEELSPSFFDLDKDLSYLDDDIILSLRDDRLNIAHHMLATKYAVVNVNLDKVVTYENIHSNFNGQYAGVYAEDTLVDRLDNHKLWLDIIEIKGNTLFISGFLMSFFEDDEIEIEISKKNQIYMAKKVYYANNAKKFLNCSLESQFNFDAEIPLKEKENCVIVLST